VVDSQLMPPIRPMVFMGSPWFVEWRKSPIGMEEMACLFRYQKGNMEH